MRILLVDDDTSVIQALLAIVKTIDGHEVRVATTGEQAIQNAETLGGLDILVTDVVMEPMDGFTLRDEMKARYPDLRTILISGYDLSDYPEQTKDHQFLAKPIDADALVAALQKEIADLAPPPPPPPAPAPVPVAPKVVVTPVAQPRPVAVPTPTATPRAATPVAAAAPQPRAVARPVAAPAATPVAVPKATAVPQPVATPRATAAPQPVAVPKATAAAQPVAVPRTTAAPQPVAVPRATAAPQPVAVPKATASPKPVVAPRVAGAPQPVATPRPAIPQPAAAPKVAAAPKAAAVARPAAPGAPRAAVAPPAPAPAIPPLQTKPGEFTGQSIGAYQVGEQTGADDWGVVYAAVQTGINRPVSLHVMSADRAADEAGRLRFIADARAKANVQHPSILAVYEAGDNDGRIFYAHEYVDGQNLAQLASNGHKITEATALNVLRTASEGAAYFDANQIPHLPVDGTSIHVGTDGQPRLSNLAVQNSDRPSTPADEIVALGRAMFGVVHTGPGFSEGMRGLLGRMVQAPGSGLTSWADVIAGVKSIEPKNIPTHVAEIGAQDRAAAAALEAVRVQKKKEMRRNIISVVSFVVLSALLIAYVMRNRQRVVAKMIHIPAGTYTVGQKKVTLPEFWIDKYEVTVGQYSRFIDYLDEHPGNSRDFDHPKQPKHLEHKPQYWAIYYGQAANGGAVHSAPYTLDSPMVDVTFWDAFAYAKWLGRELPTEAQWEAAARGAEGNVYPWGNDPDEKKVNSGADFVKNDPGAKGKVDGFNFWSRVDKVAGDKSPFGVIGMAGNVSEWTNTWTPDNRFPIVKGGNYMSADVRLDKRVEDQDGSKGAEHIGFRTVTSSKPTNAE